MSKKCACGKWTAVGESTCKDCRTQAAPGAPGARSAAAPERTSAAALADEKALKNFTNVAVSEQGDEPRRFKSWETLAERRVLDNNPFMEGASDATRARRAQRDAEMEAYVVAHRELQASAIAAQQQLDHAVELKTQDAAATVTSAHGAAIALTFRAEGSLSGADMSCSVLLQLPMRDVLEKVAGHFKDAEIGRLTLIAPSGQHVYIHLNVGETELCDGDVVTVQILNEKYTFGATRMIVRPRQVDPLHEKLMDDMRDYTSHLLRDHPLPKREERDVGCSRATLLHALSTMCEQGGRECVFFNSREKGAHGCVRDDTGGLPALASPDVDEVAITFEKIDGIVTDVNIGNRSSAEVLGSKADYGKIERKLRATCAEAIGVREADLRDLRIVAGSYRVVFSAKGWSKLMKDSLEDAVAWFFQQFGSNQRVTVATHPLFKRVHLDVALFDPAGDKSTFQGLDWEVGPEGGKETYHQPAGDQQWRRYGLAVMGKYKDGDGWLHPFGDSQNWWRVYHAPSTEGLTGIAQAAGGNFASGHAGAVWASSGGKLDAGVYVTPHLEYAAGPYANTVTLTAEEDTSDVRHYVVVFQCAVKPGERLRSDHPGAHRNWRGNADVKKIFTDRYKGADSEWTFREEHVRPYGILLGNVDHLNEKFAPYRFAESWKSGARFGWREDEEDEED